ncbi:MAG: fibronectin type III domain-containing protein [Paludibacteraceae bacterium]|nr:fibronectin type III domain-containing protein [Paludibacteraceae bacterium]
MKKILSLFCAMAIVLGVSAQPIALEKAVKLDKAIVNADLKKAPAARKAKAADEWIELGEATVTESFGSLFSIDEETYTTTAYKSATIEGLFAIDNEWYDGNEGSSSIIAIHAEDPELCYILPTYLTYTSESYGYLGTLSAAGQYLDAGYSQDVIVNYLGDGADVWGKKVKNVITFSEDAMLVVLSAYKSGQPGYFYGKQFIVELPDLEAPVIKAVTEEYVGSVSAIFAIDVEDDVDDVDSLTFTVKNGDEVIMANGKTENGKLTITGLTKNTAYNLSLIAADRAGHESDAKDFSFTTIAEADEEAPVLAKAELKEVSDKWATISVEATDNESTAEEIRFIVKFAEESQIVLAAEEGVLTLEGLTPSTAYSISVIARDKAGNVSEAKAINFTTLEIIPIVLNVDWAQAKYWADYSEPGAYNYDLSFWEGENYATFDVYAEKEAALSGEYSVENERIGLGQYSKVIYNGATPKVVDAEIKLVYVSRDENGLATYDASFEAFCEDGNLYKGAVQIMVYTYKGSGSSSTIVPMSGEVDTETGVENAVVAEKAAKRIENGQLIIRKNGKNFNAQGVEVR